MDSLYRCKRAKASSSRSTADIRPAENSVARRRRHVITPPTLATYEEFYFPIPYELLSPMSSKLPVVLRSLLYSYVLYCSNCIKPSPAYTMLVAIATYKDATEYVHDSENLAPQSRENFFDIFGTTGCVLNCKDSIRQDVELDQAKEEQSRAVRRKMKASQAEYCKKLSLTWFIASDIATSAIKGCGSCSVLSQILVMVFDNTQQSQPRAYEYSVSHDFKLKRRRLGEET
ncbi:hypothetical protein BKA65DRAFT_485091 [Rhexocercosporidium sp. MPI-PUGE-AT-0058]|nr:hypothetical protein BKA65DRAFT_485091 [Rhexocercosporidium sp. MPI-PUGE-AT-0058]